MTKNQQARTEQHWGQIAGEKVSVEFSGGVVYGFCGELGARRLVDKMKHGRAEYSQNLGSWFYCNS